MELPDIAEAVEGWNSKAEATDRAHFVTVNAGDDPKSLSVFVEDRRVCGIWSDTVARALPAGDDGSLTLECEECEVNATLATLTAGNARILAVNPAQRDLESLFLELTDAGHGARKIS